jgi:Flp pilus assembly pilin Flp
VELFRRLIADDRGQDLAEYAISLTILTVLTVVAVFSIRGNLQTLWRNIEAAMH